MTVSTTAAIAPDPAAGSSGIHVRGLSKSYGAMVAVREISFDVAPGRVLGLLGPNGAGKSTTLRMMLGLCTPTAGTSTVAGQRYIDLKYPTRHVGAALSNDAYLPGRTGRQHLRCWAGAAGADRDRIQELLNLVELQQAADRPVSQYSLGMKQRLALATALLGDPEILILDEPATGLDPRGIHWLRGFVRRFAERGGAVVISSHLLGEVEQMVDDVVLIDRGEVVLASSMEELFGGGNWSVLMGPDIDRVTSELADGRWEFVPLGPGVQRVLAPYPEVSAQVQQGGYRVYVYPGNLEGVFLALTLPIDGVSSGTEAGAC